MWYAVGVMYRATLRRVPTDTLNCGWGVSSVPGIDGAPPYAEGIMVLVIVHVDSSPFGGFIMLLVSFLSVGGLGIEWYYRLLVWEYGNGWMNKRCGTRIERGLWTGTVIWIVVCIGILISTNRYESVMWYIMKDTHIRLDLRVDRFRLSISYSSRNPIITANSITVT